MNAVWTGGYIIMVAEGQWIIESDPAQRVYPTAEDAAEAMIAAKGDMRQVRWTGAA